MSHDSERNFCIYVKNIYPDFFINKQILDCGSLDINGNNRFLFENCEYIGIDVGEGPNVDIVSLIHEFNYPKQYFDTIISTECFEHDIYYKKSLKNICRLLKPCSLFLFTCATTGRAEHGTQYKSPQSSPFTSMTKNKKWNIYYKNLIEDDIREAINIDKIFKIYEFKTNDDNHDLYFWGIKK